MALKVNINYGDELITSTDAVGEITTLTTNGKLLEDNIVIDVVSNTEDATATANDILASKTAYGSAGTKLTGNIATKSNSDLTATDNTVSGPVGYYSTAISKSVPVSTLDNSIISGGTEEEATGDYAWKSTVSIPKGYHNALTLTKTFSSIFPAPETEGTADKMRSGYQLYNHEGKLITGIMANQTPGFDGGTLSGGTITPAITAPTVEYHEQGTFTTATSYGVTTTKPSGTDGTDYLTIDATHTENNGQVSGSATINRAAVLYNGAVNGYVNVADNTTALAAGTGTATVTTTAIDPAVTDNFEPYYIPIKTPAFDGGAATIKTSSSSATGTNITISDTDTDPGSGIKIVTSGSATPTRASILYNGAVQGAVNIADNTTASAAADGSATTVTSNTYYVTGVTVPSSKALSVGAVGTTNVTFPTSGSGVVSVAGTTVASSGALTTTSASVSGATVSYGTGWITGGSKTVASGSATTPATTKQQSAPTFSLSGNTLTATVAATSVSVTPTVSAGYVSSGTAGTITMSSNSATYTIPVYDYSYTTA